MFNNSAKMMFFSIMIMGSMISISSNSWLSAWMGLEINLLSFIPLMSDMKLMSTEASLKYFLTQALASSILLFSSIILYMNLNIYFSNNFLKMMIISSLFMKSGAAPFHFWFPNVMEGLSWINSLILMTWQKIAPLMLISYMMIKPMILLSIIFSCIIGSIGGLNQTSLRKLMAYSSINHLSWMLICIYNNSSLWVMYFLIYSLLSFMVILMFEMFKISFTNQLFMSFFNSKILKYFLFMNLLSLGGLPPFLGFYPKWMIIQMMTSNNQLILLFLLVLTTLITLFFYLRLTYSTFLINYYEMNWLYNSFYSKMPMLMSYSMISSLGLFVISSMYYMF
uniref:NADH dehydrogenase subunit 2 n=1 Tax=Ornithomya biloba TaxID=452742 RepID=UPI001F14441C|nr:NADH dehydrogenase subunit 2 [Ornithomya biloba]UKS08892.1 NADH dehydrogenase subunit 2 [Ornithomya biloba]